MKEKQKKINKGESEAKCCCANNKHFAKIQPNRSTTLIHCSSFSPLTVPFFFVCYLQNRIEFADEFALAIKAHEKRAHVKRNVNVTEIVTTSVAYSLHILT